MLLEEDLKQLFVEVIKGAGAGGNIDDVPNPAELIDMVSSPDGMAAEDGVGGNMSTISSISGTVPSLLKAEVAALKAETDAMKTRNEVMKAEYDALVAEVDALRAENAAR